MRRRRGPGRAAQAIPFIRARRRDAGRLPTAQVLCQVWDSSEGRSGNGREGPITDWGRGGRGGRAAHYPPPPSPTQRLCRSCKQRQLTRCVAIRSFLLLHLCHVDQELSRRPEVDQERGGAQANARDVRCQVWILAKLIGEPTHAIAIATTTRQERDPQKHRGFAAPDDALGLYFDFRRHRFTSALSRRGSYPSSGACSQNASNFRTCSAFGLPGILARSSIVSPRSRRPAIVGPS